MRASVPHRQPRAERTFAGGAPRSGGRDRSGRRSVVPAQGHCVASVSALDRFSEATRAWFTGAFAAADRRPGGRLGRDQQRRARPGRRAHRLRQDAGGVPVVARPAGRRPPPADEQRRCRVLYVSPAQGAGRRRRAQPAGPADRHRPGRRPARPAAPGDPRSASAPATPRPTSGARSPGGPTDILITTPESLFLLLTSAAREALRGVETVIVDEVHAVAATKRGAHLAVSLERLDELLEPPGPADRPVGDGAPDRGGRHASSPAAAPVEIVAPPSTQASGTSRSSSRSRT